MLPSRAGTPPNSLFWRIVHFPLVLLVIGVALQVGVQFGLSLLANGHRPDRWAALAVALLVAGLSILTYHGFTRLIERRHDLEFSRHHALPELAEGLIAGVLLFSVVIAIIALFGGYRILGTRSAWALLTPVSISIVSGVCEEILFRALFFRLIERWLGSWIALALSAGLFGALHLGNQGASITAAVAIAFEAGIMLAAVYMITRRLWAAIGLHAAWNFTQGGIYGVLVSGFDSGGVLVSDMRGPTLLTGGAFGAEASLVAMVVCTLFGIGLLVVAWRRGRFVDPFWARRRAPVQRDAAAV